MIRLGIPRQLFVVLLYSLLAPALVFSADSTPLIDAIKNGQKDQFKSLLDSGATCDSVTKDSHNHSAAMWIILRGTSDMLQSCLDHGGSLPKDTPHFAAIPETAKNGRDDMTAFLLAHNYKVDARDRYGNTGLMLAAASCRTDTVKLLLANQADPNLQDDILQTALIKAAQNGCMPVLNFLIAQKPKINLDMQDKFGYTALFWAAHDHRPDAVQALLAAGAKKDIRAKDGTLAADVAKRRGYTDMFQALQ